MPDWGCMSKSFLCRRGRMPPGNFGMREVSKKASARRLLALGEAYLAKLPAEFPHAVRSLTPAVNCETMQRCDARHARLIRFVHPPDSTSCPKGDVQSTHKRKRPDLTSDGVSGVGPQGRPRPRSVGLGIGSRYGQSHTISLHMATRCCPPTCRFSGALGRDQIRAIGMKSPARSSFSWCTKRASVHLRGWDRRSRLPAVRLRVRRGPDPERGGKKRCGHRRLPGARSGVRRRRCDGSRAARRRTFRNVANPLRHRRIGPGHLSRQSV